MAIEISTTEVVRDSVPTLNLDQVELREHSFRVSDYYRSRMPSRPRTVTSTETNVEPRSRLFEIAQGREPKRWLADVVRNGKRQVIQSIAAVIPLIP